MVTKVKIDGKVYNSLVEGAASLGINPAALYNRLNYYKHKINGHVCEYADKKQLDKVKNKHVLNPLIKELGIDKINPKLTIRISNRLNDNKIYTLEDLTKYSENDLLKMPDFGRKCLEVMNKALAKKYLWLAPNFVHTEKEYIDSIDQLELSVRAYNALRNNRIFKISQLLKMTKEDFMKIPKLGEKSFIEITTNLNYLPQKLLKEIKKENNND